MHRRQIRYAVTMAFRTACFLAMIWVPGPARWLLLGAAAVLPYIAVIAASQADRRRPEPRGGPDIVRPAIGDGPVPGPDRSGATADADGTDLRADDPYAGQQEVGLREDVA